MLQNIGLPEIIIILLIIFIFFGHDALINFAQQLGKAGKELKNVGAEYKDTIAELQKETPTKIARKKKKGGDN